MSRTKVETSKAPNPSGAYSQGIVANGFLFTAGLGPLDPESGSIVGDDVATQTRQVMRNIASILDTRGLTFADVVKVTAHLAEPDRDFAAYNAAYEDFLRAPYPVRTTVGSTLAAILVEIDVIAALPTTST